MDSSVKEDAREFAMSLQNRLRKIEGKILSFRNVLKIESVRSPDFNNVLGVYDDWFDIEENKKQENGK